MKMRRGRVDKNSQKIYLVCKVCKESQLFKNFKFLEVVSWKVFFLPCSLCFEQGSRIELTSNWHLIFPYTIIPESNI